MTKKSLSSSHAREARKRPSSHAREEAAAWHQLFNGFSLDSEDIDGAEEEEISQNAEAGENSAAMHGLYGGRGGDLDEWTRTPATGIPTQARSSRPGDGTAASIRPYAWTGGRTKSAASGVTFELETLIGTDISPNSSVESSEHQAIVQLCRQTRSVAEIGALLSLPVGVVRVLLGDMLELGLVAIHSQTVAPDDHTQIDLMERVLSGLKRL